MITTEQKQQNQKSLSTEFGSKFTTGAKIQKNKCFNRYGGRGISVCERWKIFENFIEDMGYRPICGKKMSVERLNVNGDYDPSNCVWATWTEQMRNTTRNRFIEHNGERIPVSRLASILGITKACLYHRMKAHGEKKAIEISLSKSLQTN